MTTPQPHPWTDVVPLGETMALMKADTAGPLAHASALSLGIGGAESNVAIALRRLGTSVTWAGRVGEDSLGDLVVRELRAENLSVIASYDPQAPTTGLMIKERRTMDAQKVWYYRQGSAGSRLSPDDVPAGHIAAAKLLHITGITPALSISAADAVHLAIDHARVAGTTVSFDLNYRSALWGPEEAGEQFRTIAARSDLLFAGEDEAALAVGGGTPLQLAQLCDLGPRQVIIKRGAAGCLALIDGKEYLQVAIPVRAVDTVGAGDAFVGGYIAELLRGEAAPLRLLTAARTGAFACLIPGDWEGMPRRKELALLDAGDPVAR